MAKINKFGHIQGNHHYFLIVVGCLSNRISVIERVSYEHITEMYGFQYDNTNLDKLKPGDVIENGETIRKSTSFDEFNNRMDGTNLRAVYCSSEKGIEDGVILSRSGANKLASPLFRAVPKIVNDNYIPLNLYGNEQCYKAFPDIGECVKDGILMATRQEFIEESLFSQSYERLCDTLPTDDILTLRGGMVIDINVYCNNPELIATNFASEQIYFYYNQHMAFCRNIVTTIESLMDSFEMTYEANKLYHRCKSVIEGKEYIKENVFSNTFIEFVVLEQAEMMVGDKTTNRFGGKGVVTYILEDHEMPVLDNGKRIDMIVNKSTYIGRMNAGQMFEMHLTHVGSRIIDFIETGVPTIEESYELILNYIRKLNPEQADAIEVTIMNTGNDYMRHIEEFVDSILCAQGIGLSLNPMTCGVDIKSTEELYDEFPFATPYYLMVPIVDSNGKIRQVKSNRRCISGMQYMYRLKQIAEEKSSVTSLSSTNIKNDNIRSKENKFYRSLLANTPVKFGEMEISNMMHLGAEFVIINLMLHSTSPNARLRAIEMLTGSPFKIDIKLDDKSISRSAETNNIYFKTIGLRITFKKRRRQIQEVMKKLYTPMARLYTPMQRLKTVMEYKK